MLSRHAFQSRLQRMSSVISCGLLVSPPLHHDVLLICCARCTAVSNPSERNGKTLLVAVMKGSPESIRHSLAAVSSYSRQPQRDVVVQCR